MRRSLMGKYRKKPIVIEAIQWFKNGDHPNDGCVMLGDGHDEPFLSEGKVVRYYRNPETSGHEKCSKCGDFIKNHGWIDTLEGGHTVCPKDWIITGIKGEYYPCKPDIFAKTYEEV
jgi:hypothetical protein